MQGMTGQGETLFEVRCPAGLDKFQIERFVWSINFVAHNRVTDRCEVDANLVRASSFRKCANDCESFGGTTRETFLDAKLGPRRRTGRVDDLLEPDRRRHLRSL